MEISRRIRTKRRTPTPVNIALAGENTYLIYIRMRISDKGLRLEAYQANAISKSVTEGIKDVYSRIEPLGPSIVVASGLV